jgi:hypothetical protein
MQTSMGDTRAMGWFNIPNLHSMSRGETVKDMGLSYGTLRIGEIVDRVATAFEKQDRERMEYLNERIAAEVKPKKYSYKRKHPNTAPGEMCERCGRTAGLCIAPMEPVDG